MGQNKHSEAEGLVLEVLSLFQDKKEIAESANTVLLLIEHLFEIEQNK